MYLLLSPTLREEPRLKVFENSVMRRIFGPKSEEEQGSGENYIIRNLMIDLCSLTYIVRVINWRIMRLLVHVARMEERRGVYRVLGGM
jgi:hypothetical protein